MSVVTLSISRTNYRHTFHFHPHYRTSIYSQDAESPSNHYRNRAWCQSASSTADIT